MIMELFTTVEINLRFSKVCKILDAIFIMSYLRLRTSKNGNEYAGYYQNSPNHNRQRTIELNL